MRRIICKCPKLDHSGKSVPISALYIGHPLFSTLHKVNWARHVGTLNTAFRDIFGTDAAAR